MIENISVVRRLRRFLVLFTLISSGVQAACRERKYNDTKQCVDIPGHCIFCNSSECFSCDNGYFGTNCTQQCTKCKPDTQCEKNDGFCLEGCRDGRSGRYCKELCDSTCISCSKNDATKCLTCKGNLSCELFCPDDCYSQDCDRNRCANGCLPGYWGQKCKCRCPEHCSAETSYTYVYMLSVPVLSVLVLIIVAVVLGILFWKRRRSSHEETNADARDVSETLTNVRIHERENSASRSGNEDVSYFATLCIDDKMQTQYKSITLSTCTTLAETENSEHQKIPTTNIMYTTEESEKVQHDEIRDLENNSSSSCTVSVYITPVL